MVSVFSGIMVSLNSKKIGFPSYPSLTIQVFSRCIDSKLFSNKK